MNARRARCQEFHRLSTRRHRVLFATPPFIQALKPRGKPVVAGEESATLPRGHETGIQRLDAHSLRGPLPLLDAETADRHRRSTRDVVHGPSLATAGRQMV